MFINLIMFKQMNKPLEKKIIFSLLNLLEFPSLMLFKKEWFLHGTFRLQIF